MPIYKVSPNESTVELEGRSSVHPLHGQAKQLSGTIEVELGADGKPDLTKPYKAELSLPAKAISWGGSMYDKETYRRLDVNKYPQITASVQEAAASGDSYGVKVNVTLRGQSRVIDGEAKVDADGTRLVVEGERVLDIRDFGMDPPKVLMLKVDPQVKVRAKVVAVTEG